MSGAARPVVLSCAVEAPERSLPGVSAAHWLARELGAQLHLVHVFDPMSIPVPRSGELSALGRSSDDIAAAARTWAEERLPRRGRRRAWPRAGRVRAARLRLGHAHALGRAARRARSRDGRRAGGVGAAWLTAARRAAADERERAGVGPVPRAQGLRPWGVARRRHTRRRGMFAPVCGSSRSGCSADSK